MYLPSHIASGLILIRTVETIRKQPFSNPNLLWLGAIAATIPDVDGLITKSVAGHHTILHTPIFWFWVWLLGL